MPCVVSDEEKQREVPLLDSAVTALGNYVLQRDARFPQPATQAFFLSSRGGRVGRHELNQTFTTLVREVGLNGRGARSRPRPYDLRHAFAVRTSARAAARNWGDVSRRTTVAACSPAVVVLPQALGPSRTTAPAAFGPQVLSSLRAPKLAARRPLRVSKPQLSLVSTRHPSCVQPP